MTTPACYSASARSAAVYRTDKTLMKAPQKSLLQKNFRKCEMSVTCIANKSQTNTFKLAFLICAAVPNSLGPQNS